MNHLSDKELIEGIARHDSKILQFIYREYFPYIESYIHQYGGSTDQARDIFQEGMIILYRKVEAGRFTLVCKLSTYLYAVCKRIWIQEVKKQTLRRTKQAEEVVLSEPDVPYGEDSDSEIQTIIEEHLEQLGEDCRQILKLYFNDLKNEEIREIMGYRTLHQVVDRKYRCKKRLILKIQNDPNFRKFKNEKHR